MFVSCPGGAQNCGQLGGRKNYFFCVFFFFWGGGGENSRNDTVLNLVFLQKCTKKVPSQPLHTHSAATPETTENVPFQTVDYITCHGNPQLLIDSLVNAI